MNIKLDSIKNVTCFSPSLLQPSTLLERATPGWAQGILSAHNVAQSSLSRSQVHNRPTARPTRSAECKIMTKRLWWPGAKYT